MCLHHLQDAQKQFQSTPSAWRETWPTKIQEHWILHFNPLPPHGGRPCNRSTLFCTDSISIHSLRMEGDNDTNVYDPSIALFQSTPSAWRETDGLWVMESRQDTFQSTPSAWRETMFQNLWNCRSLHFNPLPPHGGRQNCRCNCRTGRHFNPLPPHGGRRESENHRKTAGYFNPLPPHGGRLAAYARKMPEWYISIHSLRMEGDSVMRSNICGGMANFNPLPPHGGRHQNCGMMDL